MNWLTLSLLCALALAGADALTKQWLSQRSAAELVALAEKRQIPVATAVDGKGSIPETHPLSVGVAGNYSAWCANKAVCESDLVIYVGSATGDQTTNSWKVPAIGTPIVQIDIDPAELGRNYPNTIGVLGDAKVTLAHLTAALKPSAGNADWLARTRQLVNEWNAEVDPLRFSDASPHSWEELYPWDAPAAPSLPV